MVQRKHVEFGGDNVRSNGGESTRIAHSVVIQSVGETSQAVGVLHAKGLRRSQLGFYGTQLMMLSERSGLLADRLYIEHSLLARLFSLP